jgi:hypothetical protein
MQPQKRDREPSSGQPNHIGYPATTSAGNDTSASKPGRGKADAWKKGVTYLSLVLLGAGASFSGSYLASHNDLPLQVSKSVAAPPPITSNADRNFITDVVQRVGPAVVRIDSTKTVTSQVQMFLTIRYSASFLVRKCPTYRTSK